MRRRARAAKVDVSWSRTRTLSRGPPRACSPASRPARCRPRAERCTRWWGQRAALLLLHGYPQSHLMWHAVAPLLAELTPSSPPTCRLRRLVPARRRRRTTRRTASGAWRSTRSRRWPRSASTLRRRRARPRRTRRLPDGARPSRPRRAARGARHRPDRRGLGAGRRDFARGYWHWAFLALPAPLPERLIGGDPEAFFDLHVRAGMGLGAEPGRYPREVLDAYRRALDDPGAVEAMCEDYRAGATVDVEHDDADRAGGAPIACPVLVLWAARGGCRASTTTCSRSGARGRPTSAAGRSTPRTSWPRTARRRPRPGCLPSSPTPYPVARARVRLYSRRALHATPATRIGRRERGWW